MDNINKRNYVVPLVILLTIIAFALSSTTMARAKSNIPLSGTITTSPYMGVYSDSTCKIYTTAVNWGNMEAGGSYTKTFYVKNTSARTMTLGLAAINWSPAGADTYITVSWNQEGTQLSAGQSVAATITLAVSTNITGTSSFSNTITISGTEHVHAK